MALTTVGLRLVIDHDGEELPSGWEPRLAADLEGESVLAGAVIEEVLFAELTPLDYTPKLGPFVKDSSTSRRAALDNYPRAGSQRHRIIEALYRAYRGELTRDGIAEELGLQHQSVDPRVLELIRGGWVQETPREKPTRTGSKAKLLELTSKARAHITNRGGRL